jgi:hypothetical protein
LTIVTPPLVGVESTTVVGYAELHLVVLVRQFHANVLCVAVVNGIPNCFLRDPKELVFYRAGVPPGLPFDHQIELARFAP